MRNEIRQYLSDEPVLPTTDAEVDQLYTREGFDSAHGDHELPKGISFTDLRAGAKELIEERIDQHAQDIADCYWDEFDTVELDGEWSQVAYEDLGDYRDNLTWDEFHNRVGVLLQQKAEESIKL